MAKDMREKSVIADNMRIDWDLPIIMDDGIVLRADVYRPVKEGKHPVILTYGPYAKGLPFEVGYKDQWENMTGNFPEIKAGTTNKYQCWEVVDPEKWVPEGYAIVRVDSRGAGRSPGYLDCWSPREAKDIRDCVEWAAVQPWSNGKVGMLGISYYAQNQWQVSTKHQPPHLAAMCTWEAAADFYRDTYRHGGIKCDWYEGWYRRQVVSVQHGVGERGAVDPNSGMLVSGPETLTVEELARNREEIGNPILAHPLDDAYYRDRSPDWSKLTVPLLSTANWGGQGLHARGNFEGFVRAASRQKWLEVHGIEHWTHFYTDYGRNLQRRFMDYFLKGIDNGWSKQPLVQLQIRHVDRFVQRFENEWPLARTQWTKLYLEPARRMLQWRPPAGESKVEYKALSDGVTLFTAPFHAETEITGPVALKLFLASSTIDADVFATLRLFDPKGNEVTFAAAVEPRAPIAQGWLRASQRKLDPKLSTNYRPYHTHDEVQLLLPGRRYELDVEIWPTCIVVPAGYRIALTLQGKDFERPGDSGHLGTVERPMRGSGPFTHTHPMDRPAEIFDNMHMVFGGGDKGSYLLMPLIPPKA